MGNRLGSGQEGDRHLLPNGPSGAAHKRASPRLLASRVAVLPISGVGGGVAGQLELQMGRHWATGGEGLR